MFVTLDPNYSNLFVWCNGVEFIPLLTLVFVVHLRHRHHQSHPLFLPWKIFQIRVIGRGQPNLNAEKTLVVELVGHNLSTEDHEICHVFIMELIVICAWTILIKPCVVRRVSEN